MTLSRLLSAATASYGVYALVRPRHLGRFLTSNVPEQADYDLLARTYGARDLAVSGIGLLGRSEQMLTAAMLIRIGCDVSDGLLLSRRAQNPTTRQRVLAATLGWAVLNALALLRDRRGGSRRAPLRLV